MVGKNMSNALAQDEVELAELTEELEGVWLEGAVRDEMVKAKILFV